MPKGTKEERFYQFPLCLLQPVARGEIGAKDLVQMICSWTLVEGGRRFWDTLSGDEEWKREEVQQEAQDVRDLGGTIGHGFNPHDPLHLRVFKFNRKRLNVTIGSYPATVQRYERLKQYRDDYLAIVQNATGSTAGDTEVRIRSDILWQGLGDGDIVMPLRRFRVLAGFYAPIGGNDYWRVSYDYVRYTSAGYKSQAAYEAHIGHQADLLRIDADALPQAPGVFTGGSSQPERDAGLFRYDAARAYYQQHIADVPFVGSGGMFDAQLTREGAVFTLKDPHFPDDGATPTTGTIAPEEFFGRGDRLVFRAEVEDHPLRFAPATSWQLRTGTVKDCNHNAVIIAGDDGHTYHVTRTKGRPAPERFFEDQMADVQTRTAADDVRLTYDQVRYTTGKLLDTKWLHKFGDGRHNYYSNSLTTADIEPKVTKGKEVRLDRQIAEEEAKLRSKQKLQGRRERLEALRAANAQETS